MACKRRMWCTLTLPVMTVICVISSTADGTCARFDRIEDFLASLDKNTATVVCTGMHMQGKIGGHILGGFAALKLLNISGTGVSGAIPKEVATLVRLDSLDLSNNRLSGQVPPELSLLPNLRVLDFRGNQELQMSAFMRSLRQAPRLEELLVDSKYCDQLPPLLDLRTLCFEGDKMLTVSSRKLQVDVTAILVLALLGSIMGCLLVVALLFWLLQRGGSGLRRYRHQVVNGV